MTNTDMKDSSSDNKAALVGNITIPSIYFRDFSVAVVTLAISLASAVARIWRSELVFL
jgi:hypothetical protein